MQYIVDRFVENYVVCEDENKDMIDFSKSMFPANVQVGDVVYLINEKFIIDKEATRSRAQIVQNLMDELWSD